MLEAVITASDTALRLASSMRTPDAHLAAIFVVTEDQRYRDPDGSATA
jgi:hypothetical protein